MKKHLVAPVAAGILLAVAGAAQAESKTASFTVSAAVAKACTIDAADLDMGTWDGTGNLNGASTITVRCTNGTGYDVSLDPGQNAANSADRKLSSGTDLLAYNLYTDAARTQIWDDVSGTNKATGTGTGMAKANEQDIRVYARVQLADLQAAKPGSYTDSVTATITY